MGKDRTDKGTNSSHWADVGGPSIKPLRGLKDNAKGYHVNSYDPDERT